MTPQNLICKRRVLIIEDNQMIGSAICESLEEAGFEVDIRTDGDSGLHLALDQDFDAIILDGSLPGMDGLEVLIQLRQRKPTPVIFASSRHAAADRVKGLDCGANDYLVKPFALRELVARLKAMCRAFGPPSRSRDNPWSQHELNSSPPGDEEASAFWK